MLDCMLSQEEGERSKSGTTHIEQQRARHIKAVQGALECVLQAGRRQGAQYVRLLGKLQVIQHRSLKLCRLESIEALLVSSRPGLCAKYEGCSFLQ